jgi:hypothetical protein
MVKGAICSDGTKGREIPKAVWQAKELDFWDDNIEKRQRRKGLDN